ncbi:hypothetical protein PSAC2689_10558 [Paraburkholderia sacchari]
MLRSCAMAKLLKNSMWRKSGRSRSITIIHAACCSRRMAISARLSTRWVSTRLFKGPQYRANVKRFLGCHSQRSHPHALTALWIYRKYAIRIFPPGYFKYR